MIKINIPTSSDKDRAIKQLSIIHALMCTRQTKEMKVLGYMVRNNIGGIYVMRRNFRKDIAKAIGSSPDNVRNILQILQRKKLINFISNERGGNYGAYGFNPVVESICYGKDSVTLNFVRNPVNNKIDK